MDTILAQNESFYLSRGGESVDVYLTTKTGPKINGIVGQEILNYGVCQTDAAVAEKTVTITGSISNLVDGTHFFVLFENTNSAASPKLNVNGSGFKKIGYNGSIIETDASAIAKLNGLCEFIFAKNAFQLISNVVLAQGPEQGIASLSPTLPWQDKTGTIVLNDETNLDELVEHMKFTIKLFGTSGTGEVRNKNGQPQCYMTSPTTGEISIMTIDGKNVTVPSTSGPYITGVSWV